MASFIYDANSPQSPSLQWQAFLGHQDLHSDIASAIGAQTLDLRHGILQATNSINHSTAMAAMAVVGSLFGLSIGVRRSISRAVGEVVDHIDTGFANVVDHLDTGFENLQRGLSEVNFNLRNLGSMLDWRLALVTDQLAVSNLLLENIALLLRIPDIQKERQYYIEQGFKHYNNARINPDLYQDALDNLLEAEKREKTDYVVLLCFVPLIGWIIGALVILGGILGFLYCLLPVGFRLWWYRTFNSEEFNKLHLKALGGFTSPFLGACPKCKGRIREQPAKDSSVYTCPHCRSRLHHQSSYIYCVPFEDAVPNNDYGTLFASLDNSQKKRLYIYDNNEIKGPFTPDYVDRSVCKMARFSPELPVCIEGTEDWIPFHKLTDDVFSVNSPSSAAAHGKQDHAILAYLKRAEQGDADAQYKLGEMYEEGNGVPKNGEKAAEWYGNAADQGHALAQAALGALYLQGIAVPKDEAKGFEWVQKSAVQGYGIAQFALGLAYANGRGVPQNFILAYTWFNLAAESGNMDALKAKDFMRQKLTSEQMAESQNLSTKFSDKISNK